jgi:hypothetical protein
MESLHFISNGEDPYPNNRPHLHKKKKSIIGHIIGCSNPQLSLHIVFKAYYMKLMNYANIGVEDK